MFGGRGFEPNRDQRFFLFLRMGPFFHARTIAQKVLLCLLEHFQLITFKPLYTCYARFRRRISHVPNLICELNACEVRRLNQLNSADLN